MGKIGRFFYALDELGGTVIACFPWPVSWPGVGHPQETISESLGELKEAHNGKIPWKWPTAKILDWCLDRIDENHSIEAIDDLDEDSNLHVD